MRPITTAGSQACAACKYQRRKCGPDCPLAPHFPSNHTSDFLNAHKLFGVRNILKTLKKLHTFDEKKDAVTSMIYQANARATDPVGGCHRIISRLKTQIQFYQLQLTLVRQQIAFHQRLSDHHLQDSSQLNMYDDMQLQPYEESTIIHGNYQHPPNYDSFDGTAIASSHLMESPPFSIYDAPLLNPVGYGERQQQLEEPTVFYGNYQPPVNYTSIDATIVKTERKELLSSGLGENGSQPSSSTKQPFAVDIREFDKNDSTVLDSKEVNQCSEKLVFNEVHKPMQHGQEHNPKDASEFTFKNALEIRCKTFSVISRSGASTWRYQISNQDYRARNDKKSMKGEGFWS